LCGGQEIDSVLISLLRSEQRLISYHCHIAQLPFFTVGLQNPYLVLMDFLVPTAQAHAALLGFDAISMYALPGGTIAVDKMFCTSVN